MTTTPKGFVQVSNTDPMEGPAQINAAELFLENLIWESAATSAALPASGNELGRIVMAEDTGIPYICTALPGTWKKIVDVDDTGWINPTFTNSWTSSAGIAIQYRRKNGVVYFRGRGVSGSSASMFTLAAGFRPGLVMVEVIQNGSVQGSITTLTLNTDGTVVAITGTVPWLSDIRPFIAEA